LGVSNPVDNADGRAAWADERTTVGELRVAWRRFVDERDWSQFHFPKNLAMAVAAESGELLEPFMWTSGPESLEILRDPARREAVEDEVADVAGALMALCNACGIDLAAVMARKMVKNEKKYPAERYRGKYRLGE
jgi:NTP pyrophosphatase (non-canonical NTP hydrolase)